MARECKNVNLQHSKCKPGVRSIYYEGSDGCSSTHQSSGGHLHLDKSCLNALCGQGFNRSEFSQPSSKGRKKLMNRDLLLLVQEFVFITHIQE